MKHKNDIAVSPVIGVILMVAVTVILASIIAGFVFAMADGIKTPRIVAVSIEQPDDDIIELTYLGGQGAGNFEYASINITDDDNNYVKVDNLTDVVGNSVVAEGKFSGRNRVIVVGHFDDNTDTVIASIHL